MKTKDNRPKVTIKLSIPNKNGKDSELESKNAYNNCLKRYQELTQFLTGKKRSTSKKNRDKLSELIVKAGLPNSYDYTLYIPETGSMKLINSNGETVSLDFNAQGELKISKDGEISTYQCTNNGSTSDLVEKEYEKADGGFLYISENGSCTITYNIVEESTKKIKRYELKIYGESDDELLKLSDEALSNLKAIIWYQLLSSKLSAEEFHYRVIHILSSENCRYSKFEANHEELQDSIITEFWNVSHEKGKKLAITDERYIHITSPEDSYLAIEHKIIQDNGIEKTGKLAIKMPNDGDEVKLPRETNKLIIYGLQKATEDMDPVAMSSIVITQLGETRFENPQIALRMFQTTGALEEKGNTQYYAKLDITDKTVTRSYVRTPRYSYWQTGDERIVKFPASVDGIESSYVKTPRCVRWYKKGERVVKFFVPADANKISYILEHGKVYSYQRTDNEAPEQAGHILGVAKKRAKIINGKHKQRIACSR